MRWGSEKEVGESLWGSSCRWRGGWRLEGGRLSGRFGAPRGYGAWGYGLGVREASPLRAWVQATAPVTGRYAVLSYLNLLLSSMGAACGLRYRGYDVTWVASASAVGIQTWLMIQERDTTFQMIG